MLVRKATLTDLKEIAYVEKRCFPFAEAATEKTFYERLLVYPDFFWLLFIDGKLVSFVDGFVTDSEDLTDEMYERADLHNKDGQWQMIFGVNTIPEYRSQGYASLLMRNVIDEAEHAGRKGVVLTCKEQLCPFYATFGFISEGVSQSAHGNAVWYQMRIVFSEKENR